MVFLFGNSWNHRGRVTHIYTSVNWVSISSGNGLSPVRCQAITWTNAAYCQLDSWEQISVKFESEFHHFHSRKCIWNCRLPIRRPFCPGGDELNDGSASVMQSCPLMSDSNYMAGGHFKNVYELLNLRAVKISMLFKSHIFQYMGKIFCVEFQRVPLKFHTKYLTYTLKDVDSIHRWKFKSS